MTLPLDLLHRALAVVPIALIFVWLVVLQRKGAEAGLLAAAGAAAIGMGAFRAPWESLAVAGGKGAWDALFILYVIWPALLLYHVTRRAGAFHAMRHGLMRFSRDELFLLLAFGWIFNSFLQGIAGFGTPIAIVAPLLIALGVKPVYAVAIPLIGSAWGHLFGSLATSWLALHRVTHLDDPRQAAILAALLLCIPMLAAGVGIAWIYGRAEALRHGGPMIAILAAIMGGGQLLVAAWEPVLAAFLASLAAMVALYPLSRWRRYREPARIESPVMAPKREAHAESPPVMGLWMGLLPYGILTAIALLASLLPPLHAILKGVQVGLPFPALATGYGVAQPAEASYAPFSPLAHPGAYLLLTALVTWTVYRVRGCYLASGSEAGGLWSALTKQAFHPSVAVVGFLVTSRLMSDTGQTEVLALGLSAFASPAVYGFAASWIGVLGAFMTSSTAASNVLFGALQERLALLERLPVPAILAAHAAGSAVGNAIAPAQVALGTATAGNAGQEGEVLRKTLPWTVVVGFLTATAGLLLLFGA